MIVVYKRKQLRYLLERISKRSCTLELRNPDIDKNVLDIRRTAFLVWEELIQDSPVCIVAERRISEKDALK